MQSIRFVTAFVAIFIAAISSAQQIAIVGATASHQYASFGPGMAIDGSMGTIWNAGVGASAAPWIEIDLGAGDKRVSRLELVISQSPAAYSEHVVTGRTNTGSAFNFGTVTSSATEGQTIVFPVSNATPVRYVRIQTTQNGTSWVGWYEIRAYGDAFSGALSSTVSQCSVPPGGTTCSPAPTLSATISQSGYGRVWVEQAPAGAPELGAWVFDTQLGSTPVYFIRAGTYVFRLREGATSAGAVLASLTVTGVTPPSCTAVAPSAASTPNVNGSFRVFAYGVSGSDSVVFPTWGNVGGQDDLIWYPGVNAGGGTWYADVDLGAHKAGNPEYGTFNTHVYLSNASFSGIACGGTTWTRSLPAPIHFTYFGTWSKSASGAAYPASLDYDYNPQTVDHTDLIWAEIEPTNPDHIIALSQLLANTSDNRKVILSGPIFFGNPSGSNQLLADRDVRWSKIVTGLSAQQFERIAAIFVIDEPELSTQITEGDFTQMRATFAAVLNARPQGASTYVPKLAAAYSFLVTPNQVRQSKPAVGVSKLDWAGVNCYPASYGGSWAECGGVGVSMEGHMNAFQGLLGSTQKMFLVAETSISGGNDPNSGPQRRALAVENLRHMRDYAKSHPSVVGVFAFNFRGTIPLFDNNYFDAVYTMPAVYDEAKLVGTCLIRPETCH